MRSWKSLGTLGDGGGVSVSVDTLAVILGGGVGGGVGVRGGGGGVGARATGTGTGGGLLSAAARICAEAAASAVVKGSPEVCAPCAWVSAFRAAVMSSVEAVSLRLAGTCVAVCDSVGYSTCEDSGKSMLPIPMFTDTAGLSGGKARLGGGGGVGGSTGGGVGARAGAASTGLISFSCDRWLW